MEGQDPRWYHNPAANAASRGVGGSTSWASSQSQSKSSAPSLDLPRVPSLQQSPSTSPRVPVVYPHAPGDWMTQHSVAGDAGLGAANTAVAHQLSLPRPTESDLSRTAPLVDHRHRYQHQQPQPTFPTANTTTTTADTTDRHGNGTHRHTNEATTFAPHASPRNMTSYNPAHPGWSSNAAAAPPSHPAHGHTRRPSNTQSRPRTSHTSQSPEPTQSQSQSPSQSQRQAPRIGTYDHPESPRVWTLERLAATQKAHLDLIRVLSSTLGFQIRAHLNTSIELAFKVRGVIIRAVDLASCAWNHKVEGVLASTYVTVYGGWRDYCAHQGIFELPVLGSVAACWIDSLAPGQRVSATIVLEVIRFVTSSVFREFKRMALGSVLRDAAEWGWWDQVREQCGWSLWSWHAVRQTLSSSMTAYQCEVLNQQSLANERKMAEQAKTHRELAGSETSPFSSAPLGTSGGTLQHSPTNRVVSVGGTTSSFVANTATTAKRNESPHSLSERARGKQRAVDPAPSKRGTTAQNRLSESPHSLPHPITVARQPQIAQTRSEVRPAPGPHVATAQLASTNPGKNVVRMTNLPPPAPALPKPIRPAAKPNATARDPKDLYSDLTPAAFRQECAVFERASKLQKLINAHQLKRGQTPTSFEPIQMPQKRKRQKARFSAAAEEATKKQRFAESTQFIAVDGKGEVPHSQSILRNYPTPSSLPPTRSLAAAQVQVKPAPAAPKQSSGEPKQRYIPFDKPKQPFLPLRMYTPTPPFYTLPRDFPPPPMEHAFHDYTPSCQPLDCHLSLPSRVELSRSDPIFLHSASGLPTAIPIKGSALGSANTFASPPHGLPDATPFVTQTTPSIVHNWKTRAVQLQTYHASHPEVDPSTVNNTMLLQAESITRVGKALLDLPHVERPARTVALSKLSRDARTLLFQLFALRALSAERRGEIAPIRTSKSKSKGSELEHLATTGTSSGQTDDARASLLPVHSFTRLPAVRGESSGHVQGQATTLEQPAPEGDASASSKSLRNTPQEQTSSTSATGSTSPSAVQGSATRGESLPTFARTKSAQFSSAQPASASIAPGLSRSVSNGLVRNTSGKDVHPLLHFYSCVAPAQRQVARMLAQSPRSSRPVPLPIAHAAEGSGPALPSPALNPIPSSPGVDLSVKLPVVAPSVQSGAPPSTPSTSIISPLPALDLNTLPPVPPFIQKRVDAKLLEFDRMVESGEMAGRVRDEHVRGLKEIILQARIVEQCKQDLARRAAAKAAAAAQTSSTLAAAASEPESTVNHDTAAESSNALGLATSVPSTSFSESEHNPIGVQPSGPGPVLGHAVVNNETTPPSLGAERPETSNKVPSDPVLLGGPVEPPLSFGHAPVSEQQPPASSETLVDKTVSDAHDATDSPRNNEDDKEIDQLASDPDLDPFADHHPSAETPYSPELGAPPEPQHDKSPPRDPPPPLAPPEIEQRAPTPLERRDSSPDVPLSRIASSKKRRESAPLRHPSVEFGVPRPFIMANQAFKPFGSLY